MRRSFKKYNRVMVFGVFDRFHPGHLAFLEQAARQAMELVVVVARDSVVFRLKKKRPFHDENLRIKNLRKVRGVTRVVRGGSRTRNVQCS